MRTHRVIALDSEAVVDDTAQLRLVQTPIAARLGVGGELLQDRPLYLLRRLLDFNHPILGQPLEPVQAAVARGRKAKPHDEPLFLAHGPNTLSMTARRSSTL